MQYKTSTTITNYQFFPKKDAPTIVLLHGWLQNWMSFSPILTQLCHQYQVLVIDLPEFGGSVILQSTDALTKNPWTSETYADWLIDFLDHMSTQLSLHEQPIFLAGHSFGGKIAAIAAARQPATLAGLILIDASGLPDPLTIKEQILQKIAAGMPKLIKNALSDTLKVHLLQKLTLSTDHQQSNERQRIIMRSIVRETIAKHCDAITLPTQIIWGALDQSTPLQQGREFYFKIRTATLAIMPQSGHFPFHDAPTAVITTIMSFINNTIAENQTQLRSKQTRSIANITRHTQINAYPHSVNQDLTVNTKKTENQTNTKSTLRVIPLTTALALLQQSEYDLHYFNRWWQTAITDHAKPLTAQPETWTLKLKLIWLFSALYFFAPIPTRFKIVTKLLQPFEMVAAVFIQRIATYKLRSYQKKGLQVVALAGSYGKTSVKQWTAHLLDSQLHVISTPKSVNTPLGIATTILKQLKPDHTLFIVELGEYYQGDITALAQFIQPDYGIVTPIGAQHLERMGSIESIAKTIGELPAYFAQRNQLKNCLSAIENQSFFDTEYQLTYYGSGNTQSSNTQSSNTPNNTQHDSITQWTATTAAISRAGTEGIIAKNETQWPVFTPLFGAHQLTNALPAFWLAEQLNKTSLFSDKPLSLPILAGKCSTMPYFSQRHEPYFAPQQVLILDNSYNTNPQSIRHSLQLLTDLKASRSMVITLGYVELGHAAQQEHAQLGKLLAQHADYIGIIQSKYSNLIIEQYQQNNPNGIAITGVTPEECMAALQPYIIPNTIILFEGGYREIVVQ